MDAATRWFHWINALAVVGLIGTGLVIFFDDALGLSASGKVTLKSVHASLGWRSTCSGDLPGPFSALGTRAIVPAGPGYLTALRAYTASFLSGEPQQYVGHNPLARIGISLLFLLLLVQAATGLVIRGISRPGVWYGRRCRVPILCLRYNAVDSLA